MTTVTLEPGMPQTIGEAFAHIGTIAAPTVSDLKVMCLVEAASKELYRATAAGAENPAVAKRRCCLALAPIIHERADIGIVAVHASEAALALAPIVRPAPIIGPLLIGGCVDALTRAVIVLPLANVD